MGKFNIVILFIFSYLFSEAQIVINDSANTLPNNIDRVFYQLSTGHKTTVSDTDWHLAISVHPTPFNSDAVQGVTIRINGALGVQAWVAANNDSTTFTNFDTTGMASWRRVFDSDTTLQVGALNSNAQPGNIFDYGWGQYDPYTYNVLGDTIYLIRLPDGSMKKLWVEDLSYDTAYDIEYANLDNSGLTYVHIVKANYANKQFAYLNMESNAVLDKEPLATDWDLLFLRYQATDMPGYATYTVPGVWVNPLITAAKNTHANLDSTYTGLTFTDTLNLIGWNWRPLTGDTVLPNLDYFILGTDNNYYTLTFRNPGVDAAGIFYFNKSELVTAVTDLSNQDIISIFPNPANETLNLVLSQPAQEVQIADVNGRIITDLRLTEKLVQMDISYLSSGVYVLSIKSEGNVSTSKFVVTH